VEFVIIFDCATQQIVLLGVDEALDQDVTILVISGDRLVSLNASEQGRKSTGIETGDRARLLQLRLIHAAG
jgi:hypothetical protein